MKVTTSPLDITDESQEVSPFRAGDHKASIKASGHDAINNIILKELAKSIYFPLSGLFNASLIKGQVRALWKQANVTSIHKKNDPSDITSYIIISLLSTVGKVLEKMLTNEPRHEISINVVCATSKASDQPAHTRNLIRTFASRLNILCLLRY